MNKNNLVSEMASKAGISKTDAKKALDAFVDATKEALINGERIQLIGFGTFNVNVRAARKGRNPQKPSEIINIPEKRIVKFTVGSELKNALN